MWQFANPGVLWALGLLAIPIAIHLFNLRRYKTVYFSDTRFLQQVKQQSKRQKRLKEYLILIARLLALTFLILAFARPFLPAQNGIFKEKSVIIAIDNSASTQAGNEDISPFSKAISSAKAVLAQLPSSSRPALYTTGSTQLNFKTIAELNSEIDQIQATDATFDWQPLLNKADSANIYVLTDGQKNNLPLTAFGQSNSQFYLLPVASGSSANVAIDSTWLSAPFLRLGQTATLNLRVKNFGSQPAQREITLYTNNAPESSLSISVRAMRDTVVGIGLARLTSGYNSIEVNLKRDDADFDDTRYLSYYIPAANNVVELYESYPNPLIANVFSGREFSFSSERATQINANAIENANLIIINQVENLSNGLRGLIQQSQGNLLIIPPAKNTDATNQLCTALGISKYGRIDTVTQTAQGINQNDPFFKETFSDVKDAYWPTCKKHFGITGDASWPMYTLMSLTGGHPLLVRYAAENRNLFMLAVPLAPEFSDIETHPVIVPLLIKSLEKRNSIGRFSGETATPTRFDFTSTNAPKEIAAHLVNNSEDRIPQQQNARNSLSINTGNGLTKSGFYYLTQQQDTLGTIALNIPASESDLTRHTDTELKETIQKLQLNNVQIVEANPKTLGATLKELEQGKQFWRYALLAALIFFFIEVILLRFLK